jgi:hypothetical protein
LSFLHNQFNLFNFYFNSQIPQFPNPPIPQSLNSQIPEFLN